VLRVGTRRSALALAQARSVVDLLAAVGAQAELVPIATAGDAGSASAAEPTEPAAGGAGGGDTGPAGRKGSFVREIVRALADSEVDLAVHSAKDLPAEDPDGVVTAAVPERASPFDALVTRAGDLASGAVLGTSSLRRRNQVLRWRPDLRVVDLRGNVDTRVRRLQDGAVDGLVLAAAGLDRLGIRPGTVRLLDVEDMVPAPGQGSLAVQVRAGDEEVLSIVRSLDHLASRVAFEAERGVVRALGADCALPLGIYAVPGPEGVRVRAAVVDGDAAAAEADVTEATPVAAAEATVRALLAAGAEPMLAAARES
jgi:hydroxymethylbilane synthase